MNDTWTAYGTELRSRLLLGTARYPSPQVLEAAVQASRAEVLTVGMKWQMPEHRGGQDAWDHIARLERQLLPNTAGCHSAREAITLADMSRELFETDWLKLEVIGDDYTLQPDPFELLAAAKTLTARGFKIFAYTTDDLVLCMRLRDLGCEVIMPWGAPIGTGQGLANERTLATLRERLDDVILVIDAGIGVPSHAARALELGFDAVLINSAVARAADPALMAGAFADAAAAGRAAYLAGPMATSNVAVPSTPVVGTPFWHSAASDA